MRMARTDKAAVLEDLEAGFRESNAALLTEYRGLTVAQLKQLRRSLAGQAEYAVVKNTLTKIAAKRAGVEGLDDLLEGPSAIAFVQGDAIAVAKSLKEFSKEFPFLVIKGGIYDGKVLTADDIKKLADLESREVLLAKLAGAMQASLAKAAALFQAPLAKTARTVEALRSAAAANPSLIAGAGTPVASAEVVNDVVEETSAQTEVEVENSETPSTEEVSTETQTTEE
ncbi:MAG: ribosomal protein [Actinomycetota bacterium]|jgi:large subunit ribosomal protein L10